MIRLRKKVQCSLLLFEIEYSIPDEVVLSLKE